MLYIIYQFTKEVQSNPKQKARIMPGCTTTIPLHKSSQMGYVWVSDDKTFPVSKDWTPYHARALTTGSFVIHSDRLGPPTESPVKPPAFVASTASPNNQMAQPAIDVQAEVHGNLNSWCICCLAQAHVCVLWQKQHFSSMLFYLCVSCCSQLCSCSLLIAEIEL